MKVKKTGRKLDNFVEVYYTRDGRFNVSAYRKGKTVSILRSRPLTQAVRFAKEYSDLHNYPAVVIEPHPSMRGTGNLVPARVLWR